MTATEELHRMLDERGVEYEAPHAGFTIVRTDNAVCKFYETLEEPERGVFAVVTTDWLTPEQAIAATLGACNCSNNCTNSERTGTCHDKGTFNSWGYFTCSNCSIVIPLDAVKDAPSIGRTLPPKYCPNCGRKIVDPTTNDVDAEVSA
jgi:hypothetical protein